MAGNAEIAVVIVSYRSAQLAIECLASINLERETYHLNLRVILVDNASGDLPRIEEAVRGNEWYPWVTLVLAPRNGGFAYGNNLGIRTAYGIGRPDYIHLLNPDTQVRPGAIAALVEFMRTHPGAGIAGSCFETVEGKEWPYTFRFPSLLGEIEHGMQLGLVTRCLSRWTLTRRMSPIAQPTDWVSGGSFMIRPDVLAAVGGLDEGFFLYFEETEFCHRARRAGYSTWYVPESRIMHISGASTNVSDETRMHQRLPGYWFDSRTRYYVATHGVGIAALIDVAAIVSGIFGLMKQTILGAPSTPYYLRDLLSHSVLLRRNRRIGPAKCYFPPA